MMRSHVSAQGRTSTHDGFEGEFNEGYHRTEENRYDEGTAAFEAWEAGYKARTLGFAPMLVPTRYNR